MRNYLLAVVAVIGISACTKTERAELRDETRARTDDARAAADAQRREWQSDMERRLDRIDREMDEERAKASARRMNAKAKREYDERMVELRKLREETREKYNAGKNATAEGWDNFKREFGEAVDGLERGWDKFVADLKD